MKTTTYNYVEKHMITCKCGLVVNTSSVEYFCPRCNELLVKSIGNQQSHTVYDYANDVKTNRKRISVRERGKVFHTQASLREFVLSKFKYSRGNVHKRYTLSTHHNKITLNRMFGSGMGRVIIDDTDDNRLLAKGVRI